MTGDLLDSTKPFDMLQNVDVRPGFRVGYFLSVLGHYKSSEVHPLVRFCVLRCMEMSTLIVFSRDGQDVVS